MAKRNPAVPDSGRIVVHVPLVFRRRGGRKALTAPGGLSAFAPLRAGADSAIVKAIARAFRWRKLIEAGVYDSIQAIAAAEKINASYVGRVLRVSLLAPDLVEATLDGQHPPSFVLRRLMEPLPCDWASQRRRLSKDSIRSED